MNHRRLNADKAPPADSVCNDGGSPRLCNPAPLHREMKTEEVRFEVRTVVGGLSRRLVADSSREEALAGVITSVG